MDDLPYGWTDQYAVRFCLQENARMKAAIEALTQRQAELEAELTRLDMTKANKAGRKPKDQATVGR